MLRTRPVLQRQSHIYYRWLNLKVHKIIMIWVSGCNNFNPFSDHTVIACYLKDIAIAVLPRKLASRYVCRVVNPMALIT